MTKQTKRMKIESWLLTNYELINKQALDRKIDAPKGTVQKFIKYGKRINDERIRKLYKVIYELTKV
ncbi:hypothetical protein NBT05_12335 [Aquimarina sp. ERC-38]|uniref:hypothetical protein n=1 Tax=Aquimarina sp. ERC-38 TaxID=2949996 RepID=UPI0022464A0A|nr:hypothetical protein [Aquimarina sp. ERC-38]UZO79736.1 hypothetical protein NBT05_12335 [Aquimarina sp. ERC-38]